MRITAFRSDRGTEYSYRGTKTKGSLAKTNEENEKETTAAGGINEIPPQKVLSAMGGTFSMSAILSESFCRINQNL